MSFIVKALTPITNHKSARLKIINTAICQVTGSRPLEASPIQINLQTNPIIAASAYFFPVAISLLLKMKAIKTTFIQRGFCDVTKVIMNLIHIKIIDSGYNAL
jgi:hypothetical protein